MGNAIGVWRAALWVALAAGVLSGCGNENPAELSDASDTAKAVGEAVAQSAPLVGDGTILRVRTDTLRNRVWVLGLDDVRVYDLIDRRLIRRIELPPWSVARGVCMPDLALDRTGAAFIASNAQPTLMRIDGTSFAIEALEIRLAGKEELSIGFGALAFDAAGTLYGLVAFGNSLWRINIPAAEAELVESYQPPLDRCALATYSGQPDAVLGTGSRYPS